MEQYLIAKESNLKKMGQPHVVVICDNLSEIGFWDCVTLAVIQSNVYYDIPSVLSGIDTCLKACGQPVKCGFWDPKMRLDG